MTERHFKATGVYVAWGATVVAALLLGGLWNGGRTEAARIDGKNEARAEDGNGGTVDAQHEHGGRPVLSPRLRPGRASAAAQMTRTPERRDIEALIDEAEANLRNGALDSGRMLHALQMMHELAPGEIRGALDKLEARPPSRERFGLINAVFSRWAEIDGLAALHYAEGRLPEDQRRDIYATILGKWALSEPDAALAWYADLDSGQEEIFMESARTPFITGVFQGLSMTDVDAAVRATADISDARDKSLAVRGIVNAIGSGHHALAQVSAWPDESARRMASQFIVKEWATFDPKSAAEWVVKNGSALESPQMLNESIGAWVSRDPNAAALWLKPLSGDPVADPALGTLARGIVARDPESAFAWASAISNAAMRRATLASVFDQWRIREPDIAVNHVQNSGLAQEEITELLR